MQKSTKWTELFTKLEAVEHQHADEVGTICKKVMSFWRKEKHVYDILQKDLAELQKQLSATSNLDLETDHLIQEYSSKIKEETEAECNEQTLEVLQKLKREREEIKACIKLKERELDEATSQSEILKDESDELRVQLQEKSETITKLKEALAQKEADAEACSVQIKNLQLQVEKLKGELDLWKEKIDLKTAKIESLEETIKAQKMQVSMHEQEISNLEAEKADLKQKYEDDFKTVHQKFDESLKTLEAYKSHIAALTQQQLTEIRYARDNTDFFLEKKVSDVKTKGKLPGKPRNFHENVPEDQSKSGGPKQHPPSFTNRNTSATVLKPIKPKPQTPYQRNSLYVVDRISPERESTIERVHFPEITNQKRVI